MIEKANQKNSKLQILNERIDFNENKLLIFC